MPNSYAKLLLSVNGGANQTGGVQVNPGDVVHLSGENPGYWRTGQYEIYDWPPGWTAPVGWTLQTGTFGQKYVYVSSGGSTPPDITAPVNTGGVWGKWLLRLVVDDGLRSGQVDLTLTDEATAFETLSPHLLRGSAAREASQFDAVRAWAGEVDANWKRLETVIAGLGGGGGGAVPTGTGFYHVTGNVMDPAARAVDVGSSDITGVAPVAHGGTGLSAVGANHSVLTSNGTALAFVSSLVLAGLTLTGLGGGGTQMLTVDNSGVVGAQAIPSGGGGTLAGDVVGPVGSNLVETISGNTGAGGAVAVKGGAWSIDAGIGFSMVHAARAVDGATQDIVFETQSAFATTVIYPTGANFQVTLGSNKDALITPWTNPAVPSVYINYRDRTAGLQSILFIEPTRFFNKTGIGAGVGLVGANSWINIGDAPAQDIGTIAVDNATDILAARNAANSADLGVLSTNASNYLFVGGDASLAHQFATTCVQASGLVVLTVGGSNIAIAQASLFTLAVPIELTSGGPQILEGSAVPTATVPNGSFYLRTGGTGATDTAYVRAAGSWVALGTGGGGTPATPLNSLQYDNAGNFGGATEFTYASAAIAVAATGSLAFGASPASFASLSPQLRFSNATVLAAFRNAAGSADVAVMATNSSDQLWVGGTTAHANQVTQLNLQASSSISILIGASTLYTWTATAFTSAEPVQLGAGTFASAGLLRVPVSQTILGAYNGSGTYVLLAADTTTVYYGGDSAGASKPTNVKISATSDIAHLIGTTNILDVTGTTTTFAGSAFSFGSGIIQHGAVPANTGDFRVKNNWTLNGRNQGGSADVTMLTLDTSNIINLGVSSSTNGGIGIYTTGSSQMTAGTWGVSYYAGAQQLRMDANLNGLASNASVNAYMFITAGATGWNDFGGGSGVLRIDPGTTAPTAASTSGGVLVYAQAGALKAIGASGTITTMAAADPHCPKCGADFVHEVLNPKYGHMALCYPCLARTLHSHGIDRKEFMFIDELKEAA